MIITKLNRVLGYQNYGVFKGYFTKKVINDTIYNSAQSQLIKYSYNNIVSTITYRVVKQILKFNVLNGYRV
jgi:hypothetical protein